MSNPKLIYLTIDDVIYGYMWWDFGSYMRLDVYQNNARIGKRRVPVRTDQSETTVTYLIKRMVGNHGPFRRTISYKEVQPSNRNR